MRKKFNSAESHQVAITDLYDRQRRVFLVQYPAWLIVALGLAGVATFMLTGFLGYRDGVDEAHRITFALFKEPWALYLWFCALIMALQASVLRHPSLRRQLAATLTVTTVCIILVGIIYYFNNDIANALARLVKHFSGKPVFIQTIGQSPWTYFVINFGLLAIFWIDTVRRWVRRARGLPPATHTKIDLLTGSLNPVSATDDIPSLQELISGDLIAAALLTLLLSVIFRGGVLNGLSHALQTNVSVNTCTVSMPFGSCTPGAVGNPPTISFVDLIQALVYLPLGLLLLALSAVLSGLGAVGGVNARLTNAVPSASKDETSTESVSEQVTLTLVNTLRSAINRRIRIAAGNLGMSLRNVVWPVLILVGTIAVAAAARSIQLYLHLLSDQRTCTHFPDPADCAAAADKISSGQLLISPLLALLCGVLAAIAIIFSVSLLIFRTRVAEDTLRFMGLVGFVVLLTFWIFSLALSGFNGFFSLTHISRRVPFPQPGLSTILSFGALVIFGAAMIVRRMRGPRLRQPAPEPVSVSAQPKS
ncbi:MAG TPA: hypothetical protein VJN88_04035 [Ktedonobacterales bacterium]|nr:hypothetical protein [Ktedonobacterales bacterium]